LQRFTGKSTNLVLRGLSLSGVLADPRKIHQLHESSEYLYVVKRNRHVRWRKKTASFI